MGKVLPLEGPHKHHHSHGRDASVPAKHNPTPEEHWERHYSTCPPNNYRPSTAFDAKRSTERPCTHVKVNEQDH